ncbi:type I DNA topoisomerase, partial [Candidatus Berkelbacteria bacterium]|nr:type I DNA topoisomerase [Candidatus Berkelbacteria bacterium]
MSFLVVVESPAKSRTLGSFLGPDYQVLASFGHVRDLPASTLGVDVKNGFEPKYLTIPRAVKSLNLIKKEAKKAQSVFLATDFDREGEAIAWHILESIKEPNGKFKRITFHEITKEALAKALKEPRQINLDLVSAQQARRVLDRLVGYKLSPFLWKKLFRGLSAGRVQSVALRLIVEREREIEDFKAQEYWSIEAVFAGFRAFLASVAGKKLDKLALKNAKEAGKIIDNLALAKYTVVSLADKTEQRYAFAPFNTSALQQEAGHRLGFSAKKTMKLAQDLYEAGKITYMRTDSTSLALTAVSSIRQFIEKEWGKDYLPEKPRVFRTKTPRAQEAHEAIRPAYAKTTTVAQANFSFAHQKLYELIWARTVASQMNPLILAKQEVDIQADGKDKKEYLFHATGQSVAFDGWSKIYPIKIETATLPALTKGQVLILKELDKIRHETQPPPRYTEASLIKILEEHGIGRPSTYVPIIATIQDRGYVLRDGRALYPSEVGFKVNDILVKHFPKIVDTNFTAEMEKDLDQIAEGKKTYLKTLKEFWEPFIVLLLKKEKEVKKEEFKEDAPKQKCEKCGKPMVIKMSRFGRFLACSGYPDCKNTKQIINSLGMACPECKNGEVIERKTRRGKLFYGCSEYP